MLRFPGALAQIKWDPFTWQAPIGDDKLTGCGDVEGHDKNCRSLPPDFAACLQGYVDPCSYHCPMGKLPGILI